MESGCKPEVPGCAQATQQARERTPPRTGTYLRRVLRTAAVLRPQAERSQPSAVPSLQQVRQMRTTLHQTRGANTCHARPDSCTSARHTPERLQSSHTAARVSSSGHARTTPRDLTTPACELLRGPESTPRNHPRLLVGHSHLLFNVAWGDQRAAMAPALIPAPLDTFTPHTRTFRSF